MEAQKKQPILLSTSIDVAIEKPPYVVNKTPGEFGCLPTANKLSVLDFPYDVERYLLPVDMKDVDQANALLAARPDLELVYAVNHNYSNSLSFAEKREIEQEAKLVYFLVRPLTREELCKCVTKEMGGAHSLLSPYEYFTRLKRLNECGIPYRKDTLTVTCPFSLNVEEDGETPDIVYTYGEPEISDERYRNTKRWLYRDTLDWLRSSRHLSSIPENEDFKQNINVVEYDFDRKKGVVSFLMPVLYVLSTAEQEAFQNGHNA